MRKVVSDHQAVLAVVVPSDLPAHRRYQDQSRGAGTQTPSGVCYRTAWRRKQKVVHGITEREESRELNGLVQIDDAHLGGELPARGTFFAGKLISKERCVREGVLTLSRMNRRAGSGTSNAAQVHGESILLAAGALFDRCA